MIKRTLRAARRALIPGLRFFSHGDGIEARSRLTDHASLYVHVSWLSQFYFLHSSAKAQPCSQYI